MSNPNKLHPVHFVDVLREAAEPMSIGGDVHAQRKYAASDGRAPTAPH